MRNVNVFSDSEELASAAADWFKETSNHSIAAKGHFSVSLAGGQTPKKLYQFLTTDSYSSRINWKQIHLFWGDERYVPPESIDSNFRMVKESMLDYISIPSQNIHCYNTKLSPHACAMDYEKDIRKHFNLEEEQFPRFDCILLGLGADGHTASLFPASQALNEEKRLIIETYVEKLRSYRLTFSLPVINNADSVVFLVSGKEKSEILFEILSDKLKNVNLPATMVHPTNGTLNWLIDEAAYNDSL